MKIVKEFILREVVGEYVLVPTGTTTQEFNGMITLTDTAKFIWENLESVDSLEVMIKKVVDEYDVDEKIAQKDIVKFLNQLIMTGIVQCSNKDKKW